MKIPAGNHQVDFKFEPEVYVKGEKVSLASSIILLLLCVTVLVVEIRRKD